MSTPAASPASRSGVAPSASTTVPLLAKVTVPPSPVTTTVGRNRSVCSGRRCPRRRSAARARRAARPGRRPRSRARPGRGPARRGRSASSMPCGVGVPLDEPDAARPRPARRSSPPKIDFGCVGAECTTTTSASLRGEPVASAEHPHHRGDAAAGGDEEDLRAARRRAARTRRRPGRAGRACPGWRAADEVVADHAVRDRLDGDARCSRRCAGARSASRRATGGRRRRRRRCGRTGRARGPPAGPGRITRVTASAVSGWTSSMRPRRSAPGAAGRRGRGSRRARAAWSPARRHARRRGRAGRWSWRMVPSLTAAVRRRILTSRT